MNTPKLTFALLLTLSLPALAADINPAFRGLGDYPYTTPRQELLNKGQIGPSLAPPVILGTQHLELNYLEIRSINFPTTPFNPQSLKLNLDLPTFPQSNPAVLNQLLTTPTPTLVTPNTIHTTIPTTTPKK